MRHLKIIGSATAAALLAFSFASCKSRENAADGKTEITMMYTDPLPCFEKYIEDSCPGVNLKIEISTPATINSDSERRLKNNHGADLVATTLPTKELSGYVSDLSAEPYSTLYYATVMNSLTFDGQVRFLPLPGQYEGYILNVTLTEKLGLTVPEDMAGIDAVLAAAKEQNIGVGSDGAVFGLNNVDMSAFGSYVVGSQVPDFLGLADGAVWMSNFKAKRASFSGAWDGCMERTLNWSKNGYLSAEASTYKSKNSLPVTQRMKNGEMMLAYGKAGLLAELNESKEYKYTMLPFMSDSGNKPWTVSFSDAYIGINASLAGTEKEDICTRILELLSTKEGQDAWIADTGASASYLINYGAVPSGLPDGLEDCINNGYVYNLRLPSDVVLHFGKLMSEVLIGEKEMQEALTEMDDYYINGSKESVSEKVVGSINGNMLYENYNIRLKETAVGNLMADAAAEAAGTDMAFVNGGNIRAGLFAGDVLESDIAEVSPYSNRIIAVEAKGSVIYEMLENGISMQITESGVPSGRFLQVSGLKYSFTPATNDAPARLVSASLPDGTEIDRDKSYTFAVSDYMAGKNGYIENNGDGYVMLNIYSDDTEKGEVRLIKETGYTYAEAMTEYFEKHGAEDISCETEGRIEIVGQGGESE